jgi:phenylalanyl-tRNA synthetase beta chain
VRIEDAELCPRYTARVIKGVKIGPSPGLVARHLGKSRHSQHQQCRGRDELRHARNRPAAARIRLSFSGTKSRLCADNETHRQDACATIVVRRATAGEKFKTLDNQERTLTNEMLLIADEQKGIALAGVMGGAKTEINNSDRGRAH